MCLLFIETPCNLNASFYVFWNALSPKLEFVRHSVVQIWAWMFIKTLYSLNSSAYACLLRHYVVQTRKCRLQTTETLRIVKTWAIRSNETLCIPNSSVLCIYCNTLYPKLKRLCSFETPCSQGIGIKGWETVLVWHEKAIGTALQTSYLLLTHTLLIQTHTHDVSAPCYEYAGFPS